jgi:hypothetical protein
LRQFGAWHSLLHQNGAAEIGPKNDAPNAQKKYGKL